MRYTKHTRRHRTIKPAFLVLAATAILAAACGHAVEASGGAEASSAAAVVLASSSPSSSPSASPSPSPSPTAPGAYTPRDPATWTSRQLAAQLVFCSVAASNPLGGRRYAAMGVAGIVILGDGAHGGLGRDLAAVVSAAPHRIKPFIASDEEGGQVQRLRRVIYPLPPASVMGGWGYARTRSTAEDYGVRMRELHLSVSFAPVADLAVPGHYMALLGRCFSSRPEVVGSHMAAWSSGLRRAGVIPVVKHWPGHGHASDTHRGGGRIPPLSTLETRDMLPFERAFKDGVPMVMVGHLRSKGLTRDRTPASLSRTAMTYLRSRTGPDTVIITDSLSMGATTSALGIKTPVAVVRAIKAGADLALFCSASPDEVIDAVTQAIRSGRIPRAQAEASVLRVLRLKAEHDLAPEPVTSGG